MCPDPSRQTVADQERRRFLFRAGGGFLGLALGGVWAEAGEIPGPLVVNGLAPYRSPTAIEKNASWVGPPVTSTNWIPRYWLKSDITSRTRCFCCSVIRLKYVFSVSLPPTLGSSPLKVDGKLYWKTLIPLTLSAPCRKKSSGTGRSSRDGSSGRIWRTPCASGPPGNCNA